ncbi:MAG: chromosome segregation protein SMC [Gammaproteobacteria bacterium]|nr:chromosome segregation protein SMC [Gammaproteobacteria bacterium]
MRLKKIKLSGFKSFVDPTTIDFPSQLVGVVGPNGCGKSNVIDAVRWVMGESSARQLRGELMEDVIFNGSSVRKPVGQASVELIFDNRDGGLGGQYASYNEISVRRVLSRDGQSNYYLNGSRCRRRDITDIFLGTGLGPRSYAIIEQGTISRLVEAKPEELRVFLEEAAGISRYKDRRRETELRIRDTKENLARISDVIGELDKRLQTLQRQARTAERYKVVKQEERRCKAELLALRWRYLDQVVHERQGKISVQETRLEERMAELRANEADTERQRERQTEANEALGEVQARFYTAGAEVTRIEQSIKHHQERQAQYRQDLGRVESQIRDMVQGLDQDGERISALDDIMARAAPELETALGGERDAEGVLRHAETALNEWRGAWDRLNQELSALRQKAEVDRTRIQHLETQLEQTRARQVGLNREREELAARVERETGEAAGIKSEVEAESGQLAGLQQEMIAQQGALESLRRDSKARDAGRDAERDALYQLRQENASLSALQNAALGKQGSAVGDWLEKNGLAGDKRLAEVIKVDAGWELAAERILGDDLQALSVAELGAPASQVDELSRGHLTLIEGDAQVASSAASINLPRLIDKFNSPWSLESLLGRIYVCETLVEALQRRNELASGDSIVTKAGHWVGRTWLRVERGEEETGVLAREQRLRELAAQIGTGEAKFAELEQACQKDRTDIQALENRLQALQQQARELNQRHSASTTRLARLETTVEQSARRLQAVTEEIVGYDERAAKLAGELDALRSAHAQSAVEVGECETRHKGLGEQRDSLNRAVETARSGLRQAQQRVSETRTRIETTRASLEALRAGQERILAQRQQLNERKAELEGQLAEGEAPVEAMKTELKALVSSRMDVEGELEEARRSVEACEHRIRELTEAHRACTVQIESVRGDLDRMRLSLQEERVRRQTLQEQLAEMGQAVAELIAELPEEANEAEWQSRLEGLESRIQRMGPINLAAIDECQEQEERKQYLDAQATDLTTALETLERAIQKIDNETKQRFRETFDQVNERLGTLYPRLFGGGKACLEMIGDDLLDAGVLVVARPPGKRNSSIHQLSGGEKALTAVALVFAFFELNPSPFCMLDEVDAPLDDTNAARFCRMVEEMSQKTQFIFITHNKIAMEMGQQLLGVTMHEPGVSRLVTVDIDAAAEMAATA